MRYVYTRREGRGIVLVGEVEPGDRVEEGRAATYAGPYVGFYKEPGLEEFTAGYKSVQEAARSVTWQPRMNKSDRRMRRNPW